MQVYSIYISQYKIYQSYTGFFNTKYIRLSIQSLRSVFKYAAYNISVFSSKYTAKITALSSIHYSSTKNSTEVLHAAQKLVLHAAPRRLRYGGGNSQKKLLFRLQTIRYTDYSTQVSVSHIHKSQSSFKQCK